MIFHALFQHSKRKNRSVKDALHNENWTRDIMHAMTPELLAQYAMLWVLGDAIPLNSEDAAEDEIIWWRTTNDEYSDAICI
jgi:hypothetical protein